LSRLGSSAKVSARGRAYKLQEPRGYTQNHPKLQQHKGIWARKARTVGNHRDVIAIKAFMGRIQDGQKSISMIGVNHVIAMNDVRA
jgi:hypothetical protein